MNLPRGAINITSIIRVMESRRQELGVTHSDLARQTGLSKRTIMACLSGQTEMSLRLLTRILTVLRLTLLIEPLPIDEQRRRSQISSAEDTELTPASRMQ